MADTAIFMTPHAAVARAGSYSQSSLNEAALSGLKSMVHAEMLKRIDLNRFSEIQSDGTASRSRFLGNVQQLILEQNIPLSVADRERIGNEVLDELFGFGPLEPLLQDVSVNDILINGPRDAYVERRGVLERVAVTFSDNAHLMHIIDKIVSACGRRIDESSPMVDARMRDGSRVNVIIPPLAVDGPMLSIRKFGVKPLRAEDLLRNHSLTQPMLEVLGAAVRARLNIVVSGGTGAGKTTLLNSLSSFISPHERIITIEDSAELQINQQHVVRLECRPANLEGKGAVRQRELVVNALRMRPDRIILGETRGEEALDMLQAMNTGHDGSITTVHANTPRDALARIETMCMMGNIALSDKAIRNQIASAIDLVIQISRMSDGSRRVTHISEITDNAKDVIGMQDIFVFEKRGVDGLRVRGTFRSTGIVPTFAGRAQAAGFPLPPCFDSHVVDIC